MVAASANGGPQAQNEALILRAYRSFLTLPQCSTMEVGMLYDAYEVQRSLLAGVSTLANIGAGWMQNPVNPFAYSGMGTIVASPLDVCAHASAPRGKPNFGLKATTIGGKEVAV